MKNLKVGTLLKFNSWYEDEYGIILSASKLHQRYIVFWTFERGTGVFSFNELATSINAGALEVLAVSGPSIAHRKLS